MNAVEFKEAWEHAGGLLVGFPDVVLTAARLPIDTKAFLQSAGLPSEAAPFLNFGHIGLDSIPAMSLQKLSESLGECFAIGSNGYGDPIVIAETGIVYCLDHERHFVPRYVNGSVQKLAETLLRFRGMVLDSQGLAGPNAFLDGQIPLSSQENFVRFLDDLDSECLRADAMWKAELLAI